MSTYFFTKEHRPTKRKITLRAGANATAVLPKGSSLRRVYIHNRTGAAVTGGLNIGNTAGGTQVVNAQAVAANALLDLTPAAQLLSKADQTLYFNAATAWNGAVLDIVVEYQSIPFVETEYQPGSLAIDTSLGGNSTQ